MRTMWAVGPEDEGGWADIDAPSEPEAIAKWLNGESDEHGLIVAVRVPAWDSLIYIGGSDWLAADMGFTCTHCDELAMQEHGGRVLYGDVTCGECVANVLRCENCDGSGEIADCLAPDPTTANVSCPECGGDGSIEPTT